MQTENNTSKTSKSKPKHTDKEIEMFTNQLAKKITQMNKSKNRRPRLNIIRINPLIILVTIILAFFLIINIVGNSAPKQTVSLSNLVKGLNSNEYSQLIIQDDGSVVAKEKEFLLLDSAENNSTIESVTNAKRSSFAEVKDLFIKPSIIDTIRSTFNNDSERIIEVLIDRDNTVIVTEVGSKNYKSYILESIGETDLKRQLEDNGLKLEDLGIRIKNLRVYSKPVPEESLESRVEDSHVRYLLNINNTYIARLQPDFINTVSVDWTPNIFSFTDILQGEGIKISDPELNFEVITSNVPTGVTLDTILTVLTIGGFIFLGFIIFRSAQASGMGIMQFGQSKAKMFFGKKTDVSFKDVAGIDEAREELNEIVEFLKNPNKFRKLGARIPKGILMFGSPGTGKTLLARAIAGEAGVPFFHTSGSEFEEMLVGAGASRVRDLFAKAKKAAPSLIFIDEIDAVARKRGTRIQSGSTEQTLNQILVEMDGFEKNTNVIVIAATNRPDVLDRAILRPGRFDRQVRIELPDKDGRMQILGIHTKNKPLAKDVDLEKIAKRTVGFTGADLENIMNEAAIIAAKADQKEIIMKNVEEAVEKVVLGPAKKSRKRTQEELNLVAYHEAGHAIVAKFTNGSVPVDKISIVSRGSSGGVTMFIPEKDENIISQTRLLADIKVSLGGRAAEEVALDDISTGASNDIEKATAVARQMIQKFGMSKSLGMVQYGQSMDNQYLGYHYGDSKDYSEKTAEQIDSEVREIISNLYSEAVEILTSKRSLLDKLAKYLLEKEVVDKDEFDKFIEDNQ